MRKPNNNSHRNQRRIAKKRQARKHMIAANGSGKGGQETRAKWGIIKSLLPKALFN